LVYVVLYLYFAFLCILNVRSYVIRKKLHTSERIIQLLLLSGFINEVTLYIIGKIYKNNIPYYNFVTIIEFSIFSYYFATIFKEFHKVKYILLAVFVVFIAVYLFEVYSKGVFNRYVYSYLFRNIFILLYAIIALFLLLKNKDNLLLFTQSAIWILLAMIVYYSSSLIIFGLKNYMSKQSQHKFTLLYIHLFLNFIFYSLFAIGLEKSSKQMK